MSRKSLFINAALMALVVAFMLACSAKDMEIPKDDGLDKWRKLAEVARAYSPRKRVDLMNSDLKKVTIHQPIMITEVNKAKAKALPKFKISLRMNNADLIAVLQALSRVSKQSIVVSPKVEGKVNINIVNTPWDQVFNGVLNSNRLSYAWEGNILRVLTQDDVQHALDMETLKTKRTAERMALLRTQPLSTAVVKVKYADATELQKSLTKLLSKGLEDKTLGSIEVDTHTNSLIMQATTDDLKKLVKLVAKLDMPRSQIALKAHIIETTRDTARALGIQWGGGYSGRVADGNSLFFYPGGTNAGDDTNTYAYNSFLNSGKSGISRQGFGVNFLPDSDIYPNNGNGMALTAMFGKLGGSILEMQLHMLEGDNKLRIISSPSITTMDNQKAFTESGERVPFQSTSGNDGVTIEFEDVVLRLEITPHIIDDMFIKLKILVKKDEVGTKTVGVNPRILKKQTETTLVARNGETIVIAGVNKETTLDDNQGVPKLHKLPYIGKLFGSESRSRKLDETLIFITPTILEEWKPGMKRKTLKDIEAELDKLKKKMSDAAKAKNAKK